METKSSNVLVGAIALALTAALFVFILWLARFSGDTKSEYDIFFKQSVGGLATGSIVAFQGVPVGSIDRIALMPESPEFVRVRIKIEPTTPVLQGTTAAIEGVGFTGVSQIQLAGSMTGGQPLTAKGPFGVPVIPTRPGAFGQLLASAPQLLDRTSILISRLNDLLEDDNQRSIGGILRNFDRLSTSLADRGPEIAATLVETRQTLAAATRAADALALTARTANTLVEREAAPLVADLRTTLSRANTTLGNVDRIVKNAEPGVATLTGQTLPEVNRLIGDLREVTGSLGAVAAKLDEDPAGALVGGRKLPDYVPPAPAE